MKLFITGDAPRSRRARANLAQALETVGSDLGDVDEIDILTAPKQALDHGIFASPALVAAAPDGTTDVLYGDLSDMDRLVRFLGFSKAE
ncbi:hypothetical protein CKO28_22835 [Rhodovibrio sodomensis]|uniref:KaiB domain-containing protein n=1 Tax=Rhodovibrio sodomensis TaxID=1088 RepID=A0ABS1DLG5_9PROT|nr:circadian clock KaiB family protein [Rhodovibrio sodomensis]MBK1670856.1 hypothetical protein [Rhodovibrio sodomensis]